MAIGAFTALTAAPAGAATNSCKVLKGTSQFKPPVSNTPSKGSVVSRGTVSGCAPASKTGGTGIFNSTIKSAKAGSCTTLVKGGNVLTGTASTTWKNKKVTKMSITVKTGTGKNFQIATITGKVTSGLFVGHKVTGQVKFTPKSGTCGPGSPLKSVSFVNTKPFVLI